METRTLPKRSEIAPEDRWDLTPIYTEESLWEDDYKQLWDNLDRFDNYRGRLGESPEIFLEAYNFLLNASRTLEKLFTYAHLKNDEDQSNQEYLAMYQRVRNLHIRFSEKQSYMTPEIQAIPDDMMKKIYDHPDTEPIRFQLDQILRYRPHTLGLETEEILSMTGDISGAPSAIFSQLDNVDMTFGTLTDDKGREIELTHGNFSSFLQSRDRGLRRKAFFQYYENYENHKNTLAATLSQSMKSDLFYTRARRFKTCRQRALFGDNVPESVYDNLISTVRENLEPLFRYMDLRRRALGLDELHFYDTYVPLVKDVDFHMTYENAVDTCVKALSPLGEEYSSTLRDGLLGGWVDRYENKGKRSGAYSSGCYDSPPYILMNYEDNNINSLYTLMHEAGHSMHSWSSIKNQPYATHDYTIFVAEVASTFNEILLSDYLLSEYDQDPAMKKFILNREIDNLRATLHRQTMFAEFELKSHERLENNEALTLQSMTDIYAELLSDYFGDSLIIDESLELEYLRIPHFYSAFYVYKYSTGISAATALARKVLAGEPGATDNYRSFLKLGGSMFPIDELKVAGVDMNRPEPVRETLAYFSDSIEKLARSLKV